MAYKDIEKRRLQRTAHRKAHREEMCAQERARYATHREQQQARYAAYHAAHREEINPRHTASRTDNPDRSRARVAKYRAAHPEEVRVRMAAYHAAHPEESAARQRRYRAAKRNAPVNDFTNDQWLTVQAAYGFRCVYCPPDCAACQTRSHDLTQDHITPLSQGGSHTLANIVPACRSCNCRKKNRPPPVPVQPLLL
jgi:5-methylcytosine-specific restriction endonuclease McrA